MRLRLPAHNQAAVPFSSLHALHCFPLSLSHSPKLTRFHAPLFLAQVAQLSALAILQLEDVRYSSDSMACLSRIQPLTRLEMTGALRLPASLPEMTWLACLNVRQHDDADEEDEEEWAAALGAALPNLTNLTTLVLTSDMQPQHFYITAVGRLPRLQRLHICSEYKDTRLDTRVFGGPCLSSLRWLSLPWQWVEHAVPALGGATQLEYLCALDLPAKGNGTEREAAWDAAWAFLATHPPLRFFDFEGNEDPTLPLLDAVLALNSRRPALQVQRIEEFEGEPSVAYHQVLNAPSIPPPMPEPS